MSQTTDPVLIGSGAARLQGVLAPWRNGHVGDIDIFCTADFANDLCRASGEPFRTNMPGRGMIGHLNIDTSCASDGRLALLNRLSPRFERVESIDQPVRVASVECIWAMRVHTVGLNPHHHVKAVRDAAWYATLNLKIEADHLELARLCYLDGLMVALQTINARAPQADSANKD